MLLLNHVSAETTGTLFEKDLVMTKTDQNGKTSASQLNYVSLYFEASAENNGFKLIGVVDQFEKMSLDDHKDFKGQRVRQFFLQKIINNETLQLGVLGASTTIGGKSNGTEANITGGRAIIKNEKGDLSVTVGSISPLQSGKLPLNGAPSTYIEVKISREMLKNLKLEGAIESIGKNVYVRGVGELDLHLTSEKIITIISDALVEADTGRFMATAGVRFDPFKVFFNHDSRVDISVGYVHISSGFSANRLGFIAPSNMNSSDYISFNLNFVLNKKKTGFIFLEASYAPETKESFIGFGFKFKF